MAPRASLPWLLAGVFRATGGLEEGELRAAAHALREERSAPVPGREPAAIAADLAAGIACLIPVGHAMEVVAIRWRNQILENAKRAAFVSPLPEMAHNEIMGWSSFTELQIPIALVALSDAPPSSYEAAALGALEEEARGLGIPFRKVPPPRAGGFAGLLAQVDLGDRVSVEMADRTGAVATPVEAIRRFRERTGKEKDR
jgi:hypothetical protein